MFRHSIVLDCTIPSTSSLENTYVIYSVQLHSNRMVHKLSEHYNTYVYTNNFHNSWFVLHSHSQNIPDTYNAHTLQACDITHTSLITSHNNYTLGVQPIKTYIYTFMNEIPMTSPFSSIDIYILSVSVVILNSFWNSPLQTKFARIFLINCFCFTAIQLPLLNSTMSLLIH